jgi:hypothetical protein
MIVWLDIKLNRYDYIEWILSTIAEDFIFDSASIDIK